MDSNLLTAYRWHRLRHNPKGALGKARNAIEAARRDIEAGTARYPSSRTGTLFQPWRGLGEAWPLTAGHSPTMLRHAENPEHVGLRFVGYADRVYRDALGHSSRLIDHTGWFLDSEFQDETARGVVYQLPGRNGCARYVAGVATSCNTSAENWKAGNEAMDGASFELGAIIEAESGDDDSAKMEAAKQADRLAEIYAEHEREYQEAFRAGDEWRELGDSIKSDRSAILDLIAQIKEARRKLGTMTIPAVCSALLDAVRGHLDGIREAREKRKELAGAYWDARQREAFNEAAGAAIV